MGASAFEKLRLLMWKNFLQQWRHKLQTVAEVLLPVLTVSLIVILRVEIDPQVFDKITYEPIDAYSLQYSSEVIGGMDYTNVSVAYSPTSPVLERTVRTALVRLLAVNAPHLAPEDHGIPEFVLNNPDLMETIIAEMGVVRLTGYDSSAYLQELYLAPNATRQVFAAIQFDDDLLGATSLPADVTYSLRFPVRPRLNLFLRQGGPSWRTEFVFPMFPSPGPRARWSWEGGRDPGYVNEMFIALQHSISMELIAEQVGADAAQTRNVHVSLQRFPHPPFTVDLLIELLQFLFAMMVMLSFTYTAVSTVRAVSREKELQLKESMKIMGLPTWLHWTAWFLKQFIFLLITISIVVIILKVEWYETDDGVSGYSIFTHTPWTVMLFFLALYIACTIFFAFMLSGLFAKASTAALFTAVFWFLSYLPAFFLTTDSGATFGAKLGACFSVNSAMALGFQQLLASEGANRGINWGEFFTRSSADDDFVFGYVIIMLLVDSVLYMILALYIEKVLPGSFGVPQPWYFPFKPSYWFPNRFKSKEDGYMPNEESQEVVTELDPTGYRKGVEIQNLTKVFDELVAVDNLNLNIYDEQITVLLGHNGAGKTTVISMLTGLMPPTRGTALLAGYDIATHIGDARSSLGICPQHNVLFSDLTVREHLQFFSRLKGLKGDQLKKDVDNVISKLELEQKANTQAGALSGGQQRRLCVGVALCGAPRVVLLDEPTSGMDPSSRRALWDLLQREKKERAMILTTHFMDEADILGDRIAIMSGGRLQCVGSSFFLKQQFGSGYKLIIVKEQSCNVHACTQLLRKHIPEVILHSERGSELLYILPNDRSHMFKPMLEELENDQTSLGVRSYGLTPTTLEDVFMKVGADSPHSEDYSIDEDISPTEPSSSTASDNSIRKYDQETGSSSTEYLNSAELRVTGVKLLANHVLAMWMKRALVTWRDWKMSLLQFIIPILISTISILVVQYTSMMATTAPPRELNLAEGYLNTETLVSHDANLNDNSAFARGLEAYRNLFDSSGNSDMRLEDINTANMEGYYLQRGAEPSDMARMRYQNAIGATFYTDSIKAWFSNFGYHDVAVSLATVHNALLQAYAPGTSINVVNHPLPVTTDNETNLELLHAILAMQLSNSLGTAMAIISSFFVIFYIKERTIRAKLLQKSSGIQPVLMWGAASIFDWLWFMVINLGVVFCFAALQVEGLSTFHELGRSYLVLMVYCAATLPLHYLASFLFSGAASGFVLSYFINTLLGTTGSTIVEALRTPGLTTEHVANIMDGILQFFPIYTMVNTFRDLTTIGLTESACMEVCDILNAAMPVDNCNMAMVCALGVPMCCVEEDSYFNWESPGIGKHLVVMLGSGAIFWVILMLIEYRIFDKIFTCRTGKLPPLNVSQDDEDVADEARHVALVDQASLPHYNLLCRDLSKFYGKNLAVNQVSFSVKGAECFGLLGVNGAGKTSTFKMLTGDIGVSSGDAYVRGFSVRNKIKRVHENIGYCPQFDALFEELTGRETLRLYALLRGLRTDHAAALTIDLARRLNFLKHIDKRVGHYSGGNKRKLSTALALMGYASVVYLDEPTTGVDPAAKRQVWRAINHSTEAGRSVVLTSHSMEECEALCTRLAIMVNGRFQCFGSPQHLKNKFSQGYILTVKLRQDEDASDRNENAKSYISQHFSGAKLMESYQGLFTYYLPDRTVAWSHMFGLMEDAKGRLIEDYSISQTTLEQVFLQFTKFQRGAGAL